MNVIVRSTDFQWDDVVIPANSGYVRPQFRLQYFRNRLHTIFRRENNVDRILRVRVWHVPRLWRSGRPYSTVPVLPDWAKLCRPYGISVTTFVRMRSGTKLARISLVGANQGLVAYAAIKYRA